MKAALKNDPAQLTFPVFCPVVTNLGGGNFKVELGKPLLWLSPKQFASNFGVDRDSVYRWIMDGETLPRVVELDGQPVVLWERGGLRRYRISAVAVGWLKERLNRS